MAREPLNIAFKLNWVYGADGPFTTPCTPEGRLINILRENKVWCNEPENRCHQLVDTEELLPADSSPCMDLSGYRDLAFGGGTHLIGRHKGKGLKIHDTEVGKLAFLTSRDHTMAETDRVIIAAFRIGETWITETGEGWVGAGDTPRSLKVPVDRFGDAPRFWDFRPGSNPDWRTGLFRYIPDEEAEAMWEALAAVCDPTHVTVLRDLEAIEIEEEYTEGQRTTRLVRHFERNSDLRSAAVRAHGTKCQVCGLSFADAYGPRGQGFIEVHHLKPVASYEGEVKVDPATEMAVVCANCHRMIHRVRDDPLTIEQLRKVVEAQRRSEA